MAKKVEDENLEIPKDTLLEEFRVKLIKLGLKGIEDLNNKRVQNPAAFCESLAALYTALKN